MAINYLITYQPFMAAYLSRGRVSIACCDMNLRLFDIPSTSRLPPPPELGSVRLRVQAVPSCLRNKIRVFRAFLVTPHPMVRPDPVFGHRFELATDERPATDEELFGLVRKEKAGRRTEEISLPAVVGKSAEMLRKEEEARWADAFKAELSAEGRHSDQLTTLPHSQAWKLTLARRMRDNHGVPASWIARRMGFNSEAYLRRLLAQS